MKTSSAFKEKVLSVTKRFASSQSTGNKQVMLQDKVPLEQNGLLQVRTSSGFQNAERLALVKNLPNNQTLNMIMSN